MGESRPTEFVLSDGRRETIPRAIAEITSDCNLACPGCYMIQEGKANDGRDMMLPQDVKRVIDTLRPDSLDILGGEPLMSPYFRDIVDACASSGVLPWVFSNLTLMDRDTARFLMDRGAYVTGKLNIADPEDPEQSRLQARMIGRDEDFVGRMLRGIDIMRSAGYRRPGLSIENLLRRENVNLAPGYVRWCLSNDIEPDLELPACTSPKKSGYFLDKIAPTREQLRRLLPELKGVYGEFGIDDPNFPPHISGKGVCRFKDEGLYFSRKDGRIAMQPCSANTEFLGFFDGYESVVGALENPVMVTRRTLDTLYKEGQIEGQCGTCDYFVGFCKGGCRATSENLGGLRSSYPLCWVGGD